MPASLHLSTQILFLSSFQRLRGYKADGDMVMAPPEGRMWMHRDREECIRMGVLRERLERLLG